MWRGTELQVLQEIRSIERIEKIFAEWKTLFKNKFRVSSKQSAFLAKLDLLFDISTKNAVPLVEAKILAEPLVERKRVLEDSLNYYINQSKPQVLRSKINLRVEDENSYMIGSPQHAVEDLQSPGPQDALEDMDKDMDEDTDEDTKEEMDEAMATEDEVEEMSGNEKIYTRSEIFRGRRDVISKELALALDAAKVSNYQATAILAAAAKAMGVDVSATNINESSIRKKRAQWRSSTVAEIRKNFQPDEVLTVHWDGKIIKSLKGDDRVDRIAILVTGKKSSQILGAPAMVSSSGKSISEVVIMILTKIISYRL